MKINTSNNKENFFFSCLIEKRFKSTILVFLLFSFHYAISQKSIPELTKFKNDNLLINKLDSNCINISGEWTGEEIQYDPTKSFIKVRFKVVFKIKQEGNSFIGTSFIKDKFRGSYGEMKIRGIIINDKFHFEEYALVNEKFYEKNMVWCLRSGILKIKKDGEKYKLIGVDYNGYTADNYRECTDHTEMVLENEFVDQPKIKDHIIDTASNANHTNDSLKLIAFPNPTSDNITIKFNLFNDLPKQLDLFTLTGAHVMNLPVNTEISEQLLKTSIKNLSPGIYLLRLITNKEMISGRIIKSN